MKSLSLLYIRRYRTLLLYGSIGLTALSIEIAVFYLLTKHYALSIPAGNALAMGTGFLISFGLNSYYNFKVRDKILNRLIRFGLITAAGYFVSTGVILILTGPLHVQLFMAKLLSIPVFFLFQYTLNSRYTFHDMSIAQPTADETGNA